MQKPNICDLETFLPEQSLSRHNNMLMTSILFGTFIILFISYVRTLKSRYNYFVQWNIPGPPPQFFFGHLRKLWSAPLSFEQIRDWTHLYGSIYGIFEGTHPVYIVSDVDFLQEVYIKQFSSFHSRPLNFLARILQGKGSHLFFAQGNQWRRQRHVINPTFTTAKLKIMAPLMNKCIQLLMVKLDEMNGQEFNIFILYKRLTMDVLWNCVFGIDADMQNDIDNIYMKKSALSVSVQLDKFLVVKLSNVMPFLIPLLTLLIKARMFLVDKLRAMIPWLMRNVEDLPSVWIIKRVGNVVRNRLKSGKKQMDLLQLMLDVAKNDEVTDNENEELTTKHLHYSEVLSNVVLFMVAGYESTATALAFSTYVLATEPEVQKKLQQEIDENWQENAKEPDYDVLTNMAYMDLFIREVLRLYALSGRARTRRCNETTNVCGHQVEKGVTIMPDIYSIHRNIDLWGPEDVNLFVPERHITKRHPAAYLAFGVGSRNCVAPKYVHKKLQEYQLNDEDNPDRWFRLDAQVAMEKLRQKVLSKYVNCDPDYLVILDNVSAAINSILKSLNLCYIIMLHME
ncbi:unnamed protein product [Rotaria socialis]|uniref:Cytochrome P450 n=1 Tax=Rotaria socialis TaxID=392032 RepID=A0A821H190_9BILA|nr:unnamed protein product [Rotaria socialis]